MSNEPQKVLVVGDTRDLARQRTIDDLRELKKNPPDKAKRKGGYFVSMDGTAHDSEGRPVPIRPEDLTLVNERRALQGLPEVGAKAKKNAAVTGGTEDEDKPEAGADEYEALSVNDLRALAKQRGVKATGKKGDLLAALRG